MSKEVVFTAHINHWSAIDAEKEWTYPKLSFDVIREANPDPQQDISVGGAIPEAASAAPHQGGCNNLVQVEPAALNLLVPPPPPVKIWQEVGPGGRGGLAPGMAIKEVLIGWPSENLNLWWLTREHKFSGKTEEVFILGEKKRQDS